MVPPNAGYFIHLSAHFEMAYILLYFSLLVRCRFLFLLIVLQRGGVEPVALIRASSATGDNCRFNLSLIVLIMPWKLVHQ